MKENCTNNGSIIKLGVHVLCGIGAKYMYTLKSNDIASRVIIDFRVKTSFHYDFNKAILDLTFYFDFFL